MILDEAEMSVGREPEGTGRAWDFAVTLGTDRDTARIPETVYSWSGLQKEFPHNRSNKKENVKNLS